MAIYRLPPSPFVGGRQPLAPKDLNPAVEAVEVNDPSPYRKSVLVAVFIAWNFQPYIPQQRQIQIPQAFVEPEHVPPLPQSHIILSNWNQPEHYYRLPEKLTPPSVDDPPFKSRSYLSSLANWWYQSSVLPQIGPKLVTVEEAKVPFTRQLIVNSLDNYYPQLPRKLPVYVTAIDDPPFKSRNYLSTFANWWYPTQVQPQTGPKLITVEETKVPFSRQQINYPLDALQPQLPRKLPVYVTAIDNPPFKSRLDSSIFINWIISDPPIQKYNKYIPEEAVVVQAPFRQYQPNINWQDKDYPIQIQSKIAQDVEVSDTLPYLRPQLSISIEYPYPQLQRKYVHVEVVEEKVPYRRVQPISYPEIWTRPQIAPKYISEVIVEEKVPYRPYQPIYYTDYLIPQLPKKLNPSIIAVQVDDPPFSSRTILSTLITWNYLPAPIIQKYNKTINDVRVDDPPFDSRIDPSIAIGWITTYNIPQLQKKLVPIVEEKVPYRRYQPTNYVDYIRYQTQGKLNPDFLAAADNPPFGKRDWLNIILSNWAVLLEPPRPILLTTPKYPIEPSAVNDPPFGRRVLWLNTVLDAWIPPPPPPWNPIVHITPPTSADIIIWLWKRIS